MRRGKWAWTVEKTSSVLFEFWRQREVQDRDECEREKRKIPIAGRSIKELRSPAVANTGNRGLRYATAGLEQGQINERSSCF
jgi:hypothetical protein